MDKRALKTLEFNKILGQVAIYASSEKAREDIFEIEPSNDIEWINARLNEIEEMDKVLFLHSVHLSFGYDDISAILEKANVMSVLSCGELLKTCRLLKVARNIHSNLLKVPDESVVLLKNIASEIFFDKALEEEIDQSIISDSEVSDNASLELKNIRGKIKRLGENIKAKLNNFVHSATYQKIIQDSIVTVRNDRYVIPVKAEYKNSIPGLIHDQSASGQTFYIEPMVIVEMNNQLKTHLLEENKEIERILREFTFKISQNVEMIGVALDKIVQLDIISAKAIYANATKSKKPIINNRGYINIVKGKHPLIDSNKVVPNNVILGDNYNILFITGPNTGGKTVCLKLVGLLEVMGLSGLFLPCYEAEISVFDNIFCDIGDEQSIEQNLSTFSSHIANIKKILDNISENTLILLDELGSGTDPTEGASLAVNIAKFILDSKAKAIITTHYNELKEFAVVNSLVENASMDFDPTTYSPKFNLLIGMPGASNALLIAEKLGLNKEIIERAKLGIKDNKVEFNNVLRELEFARKKAFVEKEETEQKLKEADEILNKAKEEKNRLFLQREKMNENVKKETKRLVEEAMEEANDIISQLRVMLDNPTEQDVFDAHKMRKSLKKYIINEDNEFRALVDEIDGKIEIGDNVYIKSLQTDGKVVNLNPIKNNVKVQIGAMMTNLKLNDLVKIKKTTDKKPQKPISQNIYSLDGFKAEENFIGQTTDECLYNLDAYLDRAILSKVNEVRLIHGFGSGKLREAIQKRLKGHPSVKSYRDGKFGEGEKGVTIVILK